MPHEPDILSSTTKRGLLVPLPPSAAPVSQQTNQPSLDFILINDPSYRLKVQSQRNEFLIIDISEPLK